MGPDGPASRGADHRTGAARPPRPRTLPVVGNALAFAREPFGFRERCASKHGDVVDISTLGRKFYLVTHPEAIERVLLDEHDRFVKPRFEMQFVDDVFGRGLSFLDGDEWRRRRRALQPAFYRERIESYADVVVDCAAEAASGWDDGQRLCLDEEMRALTLRVLVRTLFGLDVETDRPDLAKAFDGVNDKHRIPRVLVPTWVPTRTNRRYREGVETLEATVEELIDRRRERRSTADRHERAPDCESGPADLLGTLLTITEDDELSDEALRDEITGFLFAGHETTAMGLTFALTLLSTAPGVRERLRSELREAVRSGRPTLAALDDVALLDHVVSESLRLYPPSHSIARETAEDVTLRGYCVPEGSSVHVPQWVVHRDERWYEDPQSFSPERWTDARRAGRPDYAFFPFGGGPRQCIGMRFARMELRLSLATIVLRSRLDVIDTDPELKAGLTLRPARAVDATVRKGG